MTRRLAPLLALLALALALAGCAAEPAEEEDDSRGGPSPEAVVESFLESMNGALRDPNLANPETRRGWAERLASYFAPSERADQRAAMGQMLLGYADTSARPAVGNRAGLEVTYTRIELIESAGDRATVRVVDGVMTLRFYSAEGEVLRERARGLTEVIGQTSGALPVLRVGGRWYMTEGFGAGP